MQSSSSSASLRRSSRVPASIPILVTSLDPHSQFSEVCETLVVNAHGCAMRSSAKLDAGVVVHFHSKDGRETTARVVSCRRLHPEQPGWQLGARLDRPQNFWGLHTFPQDWPQLTSGTSSTAMVPVKSPAKNFRAIRPPAEKIPASLKAMLDQLQRQVSEDRLQSIVAEAIRPAFIELAELRERLSQSKERSKFEVSLSHIPPELQLLIGERLQKVLEPLVMDEARSQSAALLASAKSAIEKRSSDSHTEFRQKISEDLRAVEKRIQSVSAETVETLQNHLRRQTGEFHEHVTDSGHRLKKLNEGLLEAQQQRIAELWDVHRRELEQARAALAADSAKLQAQVADLDARIARLNESALALESGLDARLSKLSSNVVSGTRDQLENTVEALLEELKAQSVQQLEADLEEARARQEKIREGIENAISESMWLHEAGMLKAFEANVDEVARKSVERYKAALANGFESIMQNLGAHFQQETDKPNGKA
jgi:gas vesicle protein